jgi:hypothetical protein
MAPSKRGPDMALEPSKCTDGALPTFLGAEFPRWVEDRRESFQIGALASPRYPSIGLLWQVEG